MEVSQPAASGFWGSHHHSSYRVVEVVGPGNRTAPHLEATGRGTSRTAAGTSATQEALKPAPTGASGMTSEVNTITMTTGAGAAEAAVAEMTGGGTAPEMVGGDDTDALWKLRTIVNIFHFKGHIFYNFTGCHTQCVNPDHIEGEKNTITSSGDALFLNNLLVICLG